MKTKIFLVLSCLSLLAMSGCNDDSPKPATIDDLSPHVRKFLSMRGASYNNLSAESTNMMNNSYQEIMRNLGTNGRIKDDTVKQDTTLFPDPWEWQSCATITEINHDDGRITKIRDYGDGCNEGYIGFYYWVHGKITDTWRNFYEDQLDIVHYAYQMSSTYENYGARYILQVGDTSGWTTDGHYRYDGVARYNKTTGEFIGEYSHEGESLSSYDGTPTSFKSKSHTSYTKNGWTIDVNEFEYSYNEDFYSSKVTSPMVYDYTCNDHENWERYIFIAVSGVEVVNFRQEGEEGAFIINYGNGDCDNLVYITENGVTVEVDLSELYRLPVLTIGG